MAVSVPAAGSEWAGCGGLCAVLQAVLFGCETAENVRRFMPLAAVHRVVLMIVEVRGRHCDRAVSGWALKATPVSRLV